MKNRKISQIYYFQYKYKILQCLDIKLSTALFNRWRRYKVSHQPMYIRSPKDVVEKRTFTDEDYKYIRKMSDNIFKTPEEHDMFDKKEEMIKKQKNFIKNKYDN